MDRLNITMKQLAALVGLILLAGASTGSAQSFSGVVLDQTGSVLPGVRLELRHGEETRTSVVTSSDGRFELPPADPGDEIVATLDGFEAARVFVRDASRIVLAVARATDHTDVIAPSVIEAGAVTERLGTTLPSAVAQQLPTARPRVLESLPLLPSVVRGPDGLLRLDGARPHEAGLWIDGVDVTDPVTGTTAIDLPLEAVKSVSVLRDPMAVNFGGVLGALAAVETNAGGDKLEAGIQSFLPHPRLNRAGFGRIDGFFPRVYVGGRLGAVRLFLTEEYDFEHVPVPGVSSRSGRPAIGEISSTSFSRFDIGLSRRHTMTLESALVPARSAFDGMSPLRPPSTSPTIDSRDVFSSVIDRVVVSPKDLVTVRLAVVAHRTEFGANGDVPTRLTPMGWRDSWFTALNQHATRESMSVGWERGVSTSFGTHTLSVSSDLQRRRMRGGVANHPIHIEDTNHELVRLIEWGATPRLAAHDTTADVVVQDTWTARDRVQVDVGARLDWHDARVGRVWSPRVGVKYLLDGSGATIVKAGVGRFVGQLPLHALAFASFPTRVDTQFDANTGEVQASAIQAPMLRQLGLPQAISITLELERRLRPGLDAQIAVRRRTATRLPTVTVTPGVDAVWLESTGASLYRELQIAVRQMWKNDAQLFVSYVRSRSVGDTNDFGSLFRNMSAPYLEPNARVVTAADVPSRWLAWGTVPLPHALAIAPAAEWHSGFPYSTFDLARHYLGAPNGSRFPGFFSLDMVAYKTVNIRERRVNLGMQLFNVTRHFNPRDVMSVAGTPQFRHFTNSRGIIAAGYMMVKWQ
ncbi:MAG TPA: carboxypeptidase regulatory-like domain-containing protein [Vicinamibacterales bacterium]|jgi:hypothetical protein|nr:carboxypeptidase regulatory-like domain-containing protein [Vicinamibacterales bacterium]